MDSTLIQARHYRKADRTSIDLIVVHTMELPVTDGIAVRVAQRFAAPDAKLASAHYCVDQHETIQCVREQDIAFAAPGANRQGLHLELAGYARQTPEDWDSEANRELLARAARLVGGLCVAWSVPVVKLGAADLLAGRRGLCGHSDTTAAWKLSTHTDPGQGFPWSSFLNAVLLAT